MALKVGELVAFLKLDRKDYDRGLDKSESRFRGAGKTLGKAAAVAGVATAAGLALAGKAMWSTAKNLEAIDIKSKTVFGDQINTVQNWARMNARSMGLTSSEATGLAASFGDLLIPMGFTREQAAKMSTDVVGLSGALSEWSGGKVDAAGASEILAKAMLGEREGLKTLGISITEADVQARLAAKGQEELTGAALQQAKAMATQELIFEKSTDAQAAFASGSNKTARMQAELGAMLKETWELVVKNVMPHILALATWLGENLPAVFERLQAHIDAWWPKVRDAFKVVWETAQQLWAVIQGVLDRFRGGLESAEGSTSKWREKLDEIFGKIKEIVRLAMEAIRVAIDVATKVITNLWERFGRHIISFLKGTVGRLVKLVEGALDTIMGVFNLFIAIFTGDWDRAWEAIKSIVSGVWKMIKNLIAQAFEVVKLIFGAGIAVISAIWGAMWNAIKTAAAAAWANLVSWFRNTAWPSIKAFFKDLPGNIVKALGNLGKLLVNAGQDMIRGMIEGIKAMAGRLLDAAKETVKGAVDSVKDFLRIGSPSKLFAEIGRDTIRGLEVGILKSQGLVTDALAEVMDAGVDKAMSAYDTFVSGFGAFRGRRSAQGELADAEAEVERLRKRQAAIPDDIMEAEHQLAAARREAAEVSLEEEAAILRAQERLREARERLTVTEGEGVQSAEQMRLREIALLQAEQQLEKLRREAVAPTSDLVREKEEQLGKLLDERLGMDNALHEAQERLVDAQLRAVEAEGKLLEAGQSLIDQGPQGQDMFAKLAEAAGITKQSVDALIGSYGKLSGVVSTARAAQERGASMAKDAVEEAVRRTGVSFGSVVNTGDIKAALRSAGISFGTHVNEGDVKALLAKTGVQSNGTTVLKVDGKDLARAVFKGGQSQIQLKTGRR